MKIIFRNSTRDGMKFYCQCQRFRENGDSSENIDAQSSKIEDNDEEEFGSEALIAKC